MKALIQFRNFLYDVGLADPVRIARPVVSIGNLSMGGTGKTPLVAEVIKLALEKNIKPIVIARNYRAESSGVSKVDLKVNRAAKFFGDEAVSLATQFPQVSVYTGPKKYLSAQAVEKNEKFDLLIIDDGFQHRSLHRDFDIVLIDASRPEKENEIFPKGYFREGFSSLRRADLILLTKVNWAKEGAVEKLRAQISKFSKAEICEVEFLQEPVTDIQKTEKVITVAGIAHPENFELELQKQGLDVAKSLRFSDHHSYDSKSVAQMIDVMKQEGATRILTTEKDFVKLAQFSGITEVLVPVKIKASLCSEAEGLNAFLDKCLSQ
jgi:tetraacyldisaccharide 4'-kinase